MQGCRHDRHPEEGAMRVGLIAVLVFLLNAGGAQAAPVLQVSGGILQGAQGVDVNGTLYDVSFRDGSCVDLYGGCDALSDFTFTTAAAVNAASRALLDQVLRDGAAGNFDSNPALTNGCTGNQEGFCTVFTPADFLVNNSVAQNSTAESFDLVRAAFTLPNEDLTRYATVVYAVWTPSVNAVDEPGQWVLTVVGTLALIGVMRRRNRLAALEFS